MNNKLAIFIYAIAISGLLLGLYGFIKTDQDYDRVMHPYNDSHFIKPYSYISEDGYTINVEVKPMFTCAVYRNLSVCVLTTDLIDGKADISILTAELSRVRQKFYGEKQ